MSQIDTSTVWPSLGSAGRIAAVRRRSFEDGAKVLSEQWNAHIPCLPELPTCLSSFSVHFPANRITSMSRPL
ncbi:hypothetical protein PACF725_3378 [Pseudomonas aeruginosa]|nr:hypothetical protein PACF725_3378 [Pseudomonas aeruginosa]